MKPMGESAWRGRREQTVPSPLLGDKIHQKHDMVQDSFASCNNCLINQNKMKCCYPNQCVSSGCSVIVNVFLKIQS